MLGKLQSWWWDFHLLLLRSSLEILMHILVELCCYSWSLLGDHNRILKWFWMFLVLLESFQAWGCTLNLRVKAEVLIVLCNQILPPRDTVSGEMDELWNWINTSGYGFLPSYTSSIHIKKSHILSLTKYQYWHDVTVRGRGTVSLHCFARPTVTFPPLGLSREQMMIDLELYEEKFYMKEWIVSF